MIKITKALLGKWFNEFNNTYFGGELQEPTYEISNNRSRFGQFRGKTWVIEMSVAYVRSERDYINTFIHEMCHLYVRQKYGLFVKSHGKEWKHIAQKINYVTKGKYGTIQRCGGGQDPHPIRNAKTEKYVVFTDFNGKLSICKYRSDEFVAKLKRSRAIMSGTNVYEFVSSDGRLDDFPLRKVNTNSVRWNYLHMTIDEIKACSTLVNEEFFTRLGNVG